MLNTNFEIRRRRAVIKMTICGTLLTLVCTLFATASQCMHQPCTVSPR